MIYSGLPELYYILSIGLLTWFIIPGYSAAWWIALEPCNFPLWTTYSIFPFYRRYELAGRQKVDWEADGTMAWKNGLGSYRFEITDRAHTREIF